MIHKNGSKCWDRKFHLLCVRMSAPVYVHVCMCMSSFHTHINQIQRHRDQGERDCGVFQELYEIQCNVEGRGEIQDRLTRSWFWKTLNAIKIWHTLSRGDAWHGQFFFASFKDNLVVGMEDDFWRAQKKQICLGGFHSPKWRMGED